MNWNQLQYVITIAEEKSITKAAKKLFISQPSLSLSIQSLEKETGISLFERSNGEMHLTYAGTLFYEWAVSTLSSHRQMSLKLSDISKNTRHLIRIGISPHRSLIVLPEILTRFYAEFPHCEINLIEKPTIVLKTMLENNEIDFLLDVAHPDTINYESELLVKENILLAVPVSFTHSPDFPDISGETLSENSTLFSGTLSLSELVAFPFIMLSSGQILGSMSRKMCESAFFHPDIRLTCTSVETALTLASSQIGITFIPEIFAKQKRFEDRIRYYHIQQFHDARQICLVYHKNTYHHQPLQRLLQIFRETVKQVYLERR
ncbi:MAG: LysR family transcriptional regulator [Bariatricus sp.]